MEVALLQLALNIVRAIMYMLVVDAILVLVEL